MLDPVKFIFINHLRVFKVRFHMMTYNSFLYVPGSAASSSSSSLKRTADMVVKEEQGSPRPDAPITPRTPDLHSPVTSDLPVLHQVTSLSPRPQGMRSPASSIHSNSSQGNHSPAGPLPSPAVTLPSPPAKAPRTSTFSCTLCGYTCDKRSSLNRHMKVHDERPSSPKERVPLSQLYCHECDIQFRSRTTFQGHKELYCEARRRNQGARNVTASPPSPSPPPVPSISPRGVGSSTETSPELPGPVSPQRAALMAQAQAAVNSLMQHSMNQAALVMAPVVAPNGMTYSIPTVIMQPMVGPVPPTPNAVNTITAHNNHKSTTSPKSTAKNPSASGSTEQPLDLSVKKEEGEEDKAGSPRDQEIKKSDSPSPSAPVSHPSAPVTPRSRASPAMSPARAASPTPPTPVPILIQPTPRHISKCNECNIVFYKMENYLAHKEHYCSARNSSSSMDSPPTEDEHPETASTSCSSPPCAPLPSLVPPIPPEHNFFQFYCIPCKIKFSSMDTLQAHQNFYCPARKLAATTEAGEISGSRSESEEQNDLGYQCTQCQGRFPSARLLKLHLCPVAAVPIPLFRCPYCDFIAQSDGRLIEHIKAHAPSKAYRCTLCGYRGNTVRGMRMHGKTHIDSGENFTDDNMLEFEEPPLIPKRIKAVSIPDQPIDIEGEIMRLKNQPYKRRRSTKMYCYAEHMRKHRCEDCNEWFMTDAKLQEHLKSHSDKPSLKCRSCKYVADSEESLLWHTKLLHESLNDSESSASRLSPERSVKAETVEEKDEKIDVLESSESKETVKTSPSIPSSPSSSTAKVTTPVSSPVFHSPKDSPQIVSDHNHIKSEPQSDNTSDTENHNTSPQPPPLPVKIQNGGSSRPTTPLSPSPAVNAASARGKISPEMAAILVPKNEKPPSAPFCKPWSTSKCNECNIVFHKMENYLAHKEHYCSARRSSSVY